MDYYRDYILDHYKNPRNFRKLLEYDYYGKEVNEMCGDALELFVKMNKGIIDQISFQGEGCAISQASMSMLTEYLTGKSVEDLLEINEDKILDFFGGNIAPGRLKCALLSLSVLRKTFLPEEKL